MKVFVLILFFHVGPMGDGNSNAATSASGFASQKECEAAGDKTKKLVKATVKQVDYVCVEQTKI